VRTLLVASTGGHLTELHALRPRLVAADDTVTWATFDTPQARSLLAGEDVVFLRSVAQRDYRNLARSLGPARRLLDSSAAERVISTGAAVALAFLPLARLRGLDCHYIESAARTEGPSATGRLLQVLRASTLHTQQPGWAGPVWRYGGSVFDGLQAQPLVDAPPVRRVLVTLGTAPYDFSRLVRSLVTALPDGIEVVWQLGATRASGLPGRVHTSMPHADLVREMAVADVVVSHAGVGSALAALSVGRCPVLVPRRVRHGEHVDDHQAQIAGALSDLGLAATAEADGLRFEHLQRAAGTGVRAQDDPPPFRLHGGRPPTGAVVSSRRREP
jgi:UDP-N-acetylglucosamine transferase subunit ALG13